MMQAQEAVSRVKVLTSTSRHTYMQTCTHVVLCFPLKISSGQNHEEKHTHRNYTALNEAFYSISNLELTTGTKSGLTVLVPLCISHYLSRTVNETLSISLTVLMAKFVFNIHKH